VRGYGFGTDPIRTAVKYSLIPLRTVVQLGEMYIESGEETPPPERPKTSPRRQPTARKRTSRQASRTPKDLDDVSLARKVETVIFRDENVPKGKIDVNAADGVVWLRGEAKTPEMIKALATEAQAIPEVKKVENLLHLPKTPAPTRTDTPPSQRKRRGKGRTNIATKVNSELPNAATEDSPVDVAQKGEGRQPAPFGTNGGAS
jgi:hypothetical protein